MFQVAAIFGFAEKYGVDVCLPRWEHEAYFPNLTDFTGAKTGKQIKELAFHYTPDFFDSLDWTKDMDFEGYFQSEKYFPSNAKEIFTFHPYLVESCKREFEKAFEKTTIAIHVRRGDYVGNPNYVQLPPTYYILALETHFPGWRDCNLIFFSDDIDYCKIHYQCLPNAFFSDNFVDIADLCLMSQCDHFIIANSSFSWWAAWLAEKEGTKVVYPVRHFAGKLKNNSTRDLYHENWIPFNDEGKKIDLRDLTVTIPVFKDHSDRVENLELCITMLLSNFDVNILIMEQGGKHFEYLKEFVDYVHYDDLDIFWRTVMLNRACKSVKTPFVGNWDADCLIPPMQTLLAVEKLRQGADISSVFDGSFAGVPRTWYTGLCKTLDVGIFGATKFTGKGINPNSGEAYGGVVLANVESYKRAGMENENFKQWAAEDQERWVRFKNLGLKVERVGGFLYHLEHYRTPTSNRENPYWMAGEKEFAKVKAMSKTELEKYVSTWEWAKFD